MPGSFDDMMAAADVRIMAAMKSDAQATLSISETPVNVIMGHEACDHDYGDSGQNRRYRREAMFAAADVAGLKTGDTVTWSGLVYRVGGVIADDGSMVTLELTRTAAVARHEQGRFRE